MRNAIRLLLFTLLFLSGQQELCASVPKTRVGNFFPLAADSRPEVALQVPELRLDNPLLYGESVLGQQVWTKFDPEGLNATWGGDNWFANWVLPDPVAHYQSSSGGAETMFDSSASGLDRTAGACTFVGNGMMTVLSLVPGEAAVEGGIAKLAGKTAARVVEREVAEVAAEKVEQKVAQKVEQSASKAADETAQVVEKEATSVAASPAKKPNLNSNDATSNFGIYEIETPEGLEKVGKADLNRVTKSSGLPTRIHQQVRKLEKIHGKGNVKAQVVENLGETTTAGAKAAENARIKNIVDETGKVPPGNESSYKP